MYGFIHVYNTLAKVGTTSHKLPPLFVSVVKAENGAITQKINAAQDASTVSVT